MKIIQAIKSIVGQAEFAIQGGYGYGRGELIVVCMHSTPQDRIAEFSDLVTQLTKHFKPLHPSRLRDYFSGTGGVSDGPYILFTFDDGLKNNLLSAKILAEKQMQAIYFVVPDFIDAANQDQYYRTNIRPLVDEKIDHEPEDTTAMSIEDLKMLVSLGHVIGSHTSSHLLAAGQSENQLVRELVDSKRIIEEWIGQPVLHFASPNNSLLSVDKAAAEFIAANYVFHHTTLPGINESNENPQCIFRRNIEVFWTKGQIRFALGHWDLARWKRRTDSFQALLTHQ